MSAVGLTCAAGSAIFNGSYAAFFKTPKMKALDIHPVVFQLYVCIGIFVSSWLVLPFLGHNDISSSQWNLSGFGVVAGFIFVLAVSGSFHAVQTIGIALAQGIWCGVAMVVSYLWGYAVFQQVPSELGLSFVGLLLLVVGVVGVALSDRLGSLMRHRTGYERVPLSSLEGGGEDLEAVLNTAMSSKRYVQGVLWACFVGVFGGSILSPLHYVPPEKQGLVFLPSFGIGTLILSPIVFCAHAIQAGTAPPLHVKTQAPWTGLLSGLVWNAGNLLSIIAIPAIGYGVAYPIMQCAILVSGMWGIYVFKEMTERTTIAVFWVGGAILLLGGTLLAIAQ